MTQIHPIPNLSLFAFLNLARYLKREYLSCFIIIFYFSIDGCNGWYHVLWYNHSAIGP